MVLTHPSTLLNAFDTNYYELYDSSVNALRTLLVSQLTFMLSTLEDPIEIPEGQRYTLSTNLDQPNEEISKVELKDNSIYVTLHTLKGEPTDVVVDLTKFDNIENNYQLMFEENIRYTIGIFYLVKNYYLLFLKKLKK